MSKPTGQHIGTKTLGLVLGLVLASIYTVLTFFQKPTLAVVDLYNIALVDAFFVIVFPGIVFLAQILWCFMHKVSELIGA